MQAKLVAGIVFVLLVGFPTTAMANPSVSVPTDEIDAIFAGAEAANATARDNAGDLAAAVAGNVSAAVDNATDGNVPTDQAAAVVGAGQDFGTGMIGAGGTFGVLVVGQANQAALTKITEVSDVFGAGVGLANTGITSVGAVGQEAGRAVCTAPVEPGGDPACDAGSIIDAVETAATSSTGAAAGFVATVPDAVVSVQCTAQTAASGLVTPPEDPGFCTP